MPNYYAIFIFDQLASYLQMLMSPSDDVALVNDTFNLTTNTPIFSALAAMCS